MNPKVSIIMATFNRANFILETLDSIKKQLFLQWECLIIDDGSTDESFKIVKNYISNDNRFILKKRPKEYSKGLSGARNYGIECAKGDFIIFFDDDDLIPQNNLSTCVNYMTKYNIDFCRYDKKPFRNSPVEIKVKKESKNDICFFNKGDIWKMITGSVPFASCTVMWKKECFDREKFNEELMYAEEWECYCRILLHGFKGISISEVLYYNRKHKGSNTDQFFAKDPLILKSHRKAIFLVIDHLKSKNIFGEEIKKFFVRKAVELNDKKLMIKTLNASKTGRLEKLKYVVGLNLMPILKHIFYLKGQLKRV
ncbi:glycosyltransferase family 2 protein [Christiangramia sabulilitoris]|uniref:Glycosyltransferase n=1 Tax=Christiangramia sabulilitoris TaxID=2583991 RepID=A0A550HYV3_9FLAO|nr:glycosyltransferase family 2 protein [Christiangramia sabulilitoris]TRO63911.1 glycosyltransferase [Christiangramia sabulilitoris]